MTHPPSDGDLQRAFRVVREADRSRLPGFRLPTPRARRHPWRYVAAGSLAAIVLALAGVLGRPDPSLDGIDLARTRWISSTDFLLETPGHDLLRVMPSIERRATDYQGLTLSPRPDDSTERIRS